MVKVFLCVFHLVVTVAIGVFVCMIQQLTVSAKDGTLEQQLKDADNIPKRLSGGKKYQTSDEPFQTVPKKLTKENNGTLTTNKRLLHDGENKNNLSVNSYN